MNKKGTVKSAFFSSAFAFYVVLCSIFVFLSPASAQAKPSRNECSLSKPQSADETVFISFVYDGDTVQLKDGRKIRIIGINTPELGTKSSSSVQHQTEPYALAAKHYLQNLIKQSNRVLLRYGVQKKDHYGRVLAHLFLQDGSNIAALMIKDGFARSLYVPPNNWQFLCYANLDTQAQHLKTGLWSNSYFNTIASARLKLEPGYKSQYRQISGIVSRVAINKKNIWINLGPQFAIRIKKSQLDNFKNINFVNLPGKKISTRGYVVYYPKSSQFRMLVRHSIALVISNTI